MKPGLAISVVQCLLFVLCTQGVGGCKALLRKKPPVAGPSAADVASPNAGSSSAVPTSAETLSPGASADVIWAVPGEPVDGFVLRYGTSPEHLDQEQRIAVANLTRIDDPTLGPVYKHTLPLPPGAPNIFVSIAATLGAEVSEASAVVESRPDELQAQAASASSSSAPAISGSPPTEPQ